MTFCSLLLFILFMPVLVVIMVVAVMMIRMMLLVSTYTRDGALIFIVIRVTTKKLARVINSRCIS